MPPNSSINIHWSRTWLPGNSKWTALRAWKSFTVHVILPRSIHRDNFATYVDDGNEHEKEEEAETGRGAGRIAARGAKMGAEAGRAQMRLDAGALTTTTSPTMKK